MCSPLYRLSGYSAHLRRLIAALMLAALLPALPPAYPAQAASEHQPAPTPPINLTDPVADPHQDGVLYFPQTGHTLRGKFRAFWESRGGLPQFGFPLTEEFIEFGNQATPALQVQYFERSRLEFHPEYANSAYEVLLSPLGREFRQPDLPAPQLPAPARYFSDTGHNLSGKFLEYWDTHGGLSVHGFPITEPNMEVSDNGKSYLVQWFERSRFELHPENAGTPYEILLGQLGKQLSEKRGYPYGWYPRFGRAVDYSWVSGRLLPWRACYFAECSCPLFAFGDPNASPLDVGGPGWQKAFEDGLLRNTNFLVVFGQQKDGSDLDPVCRPNYLVTSVQLNPTTKPLP